MRLSTLQSQLTNELIILIDCQLGLKGAGQGGAKHLGHKGWRYMEIHMLLILGRG